MDEVAAFAQEVVTEVRRQFLERPGIMNYTEKPDYGRCVEIVASASLREMIKPGALAILSPMAVGIIFWILGHATGQPLLGAKVVASMLMFATVTGILMALFLNTSGGAWDNAKKYIETVHLVAKAVSLTRLQLPVTRLEIHLKIRPGLRFTFSSRCSLQSH